MRITRTHERTHAHTLTNTRRLKHYLPHFQCEGNKKKDKLTPPVTAAACSSCTSRPPRARLSRPGDLTWFSRELWAPAGRRGAEERSFCSTWLLRHRHAAGEPLQWRKPQFREYLWDPYTGTTSIPCFWGDSLQHARETIKERKKIDEEEGEGCMQLAVISIHVPRLNITKYTGSSQYFNLDDILNIFKKC